MARSSRKDKEISAGQAAALHSKLLAKVSTQRTRTVAEMIEKGEAKVPEMPAVPVKARRSRKQPEAPEQVVVPELWHDVDAPLTETTLPPFGGTWPASSTTPAREVDEVTVPSVWRENGYLVLAYRIWDGEVHYYSLLHSERSASLRQFVERMSCRMDALCPYHLALNLLGRLRTGTCTMRAKTERTMAAMLKTEELMKLSERALAAEYGRIMGGKAPVRIKGEDKEAKIKEMIAKAKEDAAKESEAPDATKAPKEKAVSLKASKRAAKSPSKAKVTKVNGDKPATKTKKTTPKAAVAKGENPYRPGSMKAACYDYFLKHQDEGEREKVLEQMQKLGATSSTARGWLSSFRKL